MCVTTDPAFLAIARECEDLREQLREQALRLEAMAAELASARAALEERKRIERAKGMLMAQRHLGEDEAYRALRRMAMNQKRRVADVAQSLLDMAEMLPGSRR